MRFSLGLYLFYLAFGVAQNAAPEIHSLEYIYTALSKPVGLPGIYEFTAMGILDDKEIDYYNSQEKLKIPRQDWMKERLDRNYWDKGTQSRKSKEQWFKVNVNILMDRMKHNNSDLHVLQWRHGCKGVLQPDGALKFLMGFDLYSYDGEDFLSFNESESQWIAPVQAAVQTKKKWDESQTLNQYTKGYLQKECMDWLSKFMNYGEAELRKHSPPEVFAFAKKGKNPENVVLHCLATGFYPKDVELVIYRKGVPLSETDGVVSTGVRPNGVRPERVNPDERPGETFQLRKFIEVSKSDNSEYSCEVKHRTLEAPIIIKWDGSCFNCPEGGSLGIIIGAVCVILLIIAVVCAVLFLHMCGAIVIPFLPSQQGRNQTPAPQGGAQPLLSGNGTVPIPVQNMTNQPNGNGALTSPAQKMTDQPTVTNETQSSRESDSGHGSSNSSSSENLNGGKQSPNGSDNSRNNPEEENPLMV
uniref:Class I histocompatibility antigen, F10 alpha chain-like n=1 Tax=Scleropages formosus TaxID=113540 RepID=A0A8C9T4W7_SCLFO